MGQKEILEARAKFSEMYQDTKLGGKGSQKRRKFVKHKDTAVQDKKISQLAKKSQAKKLTDTAEVNMFMDDNTVMHFKKPSLEYSLKEKVSFLSGQMEKKHIKDLLPNIIKQLGPKQFSFMKDFAETLKNTDKVEEKAEEAPELVDFEEVSNKN